MKKEMLNMSQKELTRLEVIQKIDNKIVTQSKAAELLNLSLRQIKRLVKAYKTMGAKGLISKKRGMIGNHRLPEEIKRKAIEIIAAKYPDFGSTLAREKLLELDGIKLSLGTVRTLMIVNEFWRISYKKRKTIHQMRERRSRSGELVQIDGSPDDWFEGRDSKCTLIVFVDDATSKLLYLRFEKSETTWAYLNGIRRTITEYGLPIAYYSDKHSVFKINRDQSLSGKGVTQCGRALEELGIKLICANSPQAKGRVERANRTLQDRLKKELRLRSICSIEEANLFLPSFIASYNERFGKAPKNSINAHRELPKALDLDLIFRLKETRYLSKNLTFQYQNKLYQIKTDRPSYAMRKAQVNVLEDQSGSIIVEYKGKTLSYGIYEERPLQAEEIHSKELNDKVETLMKKKYKPTIKHPWKRGIAAQSYAEAQNY
jgi:hypothetical protein